MRSIPARALALAVLSALLQVLCFPTAGPVSAWKTSLCWIALAPFLLALMQKDRAGKPLGPAAGAMVGYVCGVCWYVGNCGWIYQTMYLYGGMAKPVAFMILVLFSLYLGLYHALFAWLFTSAARSPLKRWAALSLAPFAWVAVEVARARITGFPWDLLGYAQVDNSLLTYVAPVGGVMAMSFVIFAVNAGVASGLSFTGRLRWCIAGGAIGLAALLQVAGGRKSSVHFAASETAVMVQENIAVGASARGVRPLTQSEEVEEFSALSLRPQTIGVTEPRRTVILWPEAPSQLQSNDSYVKDGLMALARTANAPVIAGMLGVDLDQGVGRGYYLYDSAGVFDRTGEYRGRYDKIHLVPWGEYVPYKSLFSFASKLTAGSGDMDPGHARTTFELGGHRYAVFICYESIFGDEVRQFVRNGAEVLVNISDDGWYGDSGAPWQHLNMARMRAIENHRWVLRSTNTGETTAIDPAGNYTVTARHVRTAYALPFGFEDGTTFYTRHGDWFAYVCALVTLAAVGFGFVRR